MYTSHFFIFFWEVVASSGWHLLVAALLFVVHFPLFLGGDQGTLGGYPRANALGGPSGVGNED